MRGYGKDLSNHCIAIFTFPCNSQNDLSTRIAFKEMHGLISVTLFNEAKTMLLKRTFRFPIAALLMGTTFSQAQTSRHRSAVGPRGGTRSLTQTRTNGQFSSTSQATGANGGSYTNQRTTGNGQYSDTRTTIGPHGATYTSERTAQPGSLTSTKTAVGPNGATFTDQRSISNGQVTNSRTVTPAPHP
jgi:hypothetical protein